MTPAEVREQERVLLQYFDIDPQYFVDKYNIPITGIKTQSSDPNKEDDEPANKMKLGEGYDPFA